MPFHITNAQGRFAQWNVTQICSQAAHADLARWVAEHPDHEDAADARWALSALATLVHGPAAQPGMHMRPSFYPRESKHPVAPAYLSGGTPAFLGVISVFANFVRHAEAFDHPALRSATPEGLGWTGLAQLVADRPRWNRVAQGLEAWGHPVADLDSDRPEVKALRWLARTHPKWTITEPEVGQSLQQSDVFVVYSPVHQGYLGQASKIVDLPSARTFRSVAAAQQARADNPRKTEDGVIVAYELRLRGVVAEPDRPVQNLGELGHAVALAQAGTLTQDLEVSSAEAPLPNRRPRL